MLEALPQTPRRRRRRSDPGETAARAPREEKPRDPGDSLRGPADRPACPPPESCDRKNQISWFRPRRAIADSHAWGETSLFDFYDHMTQEEGKQAYRLALEGYRRGLAASPLEALERLFPPGRSASDGAGVSAAAPPASGDSVGLA